jgi:hypothetical protein
MVQDVQRDSEKEEIQKKAELAKLERLKRLNNAYS